MPVFEAKNPGSEFDGQALLAAILHPTYSDRTRALNLGRERAVSATIDAMTVAPRRAVEPGNLAPSMA